MKTISHPSYDGGYYINQRDRGESILGMEVVGTGKLLELLSLHNGLSGNFASDGERASAYLSHVEKNAKGTMIETSFKNDPLGVAKCLLHWRDMLIMAGWDPNQRGDESTPKLQLLSRIEATWKAQASTQLKGAADRWRQLADRAKKQPLIAPGDTIECRCSKQSLPLLVQEVLQACGATFVTYGDQAQLPETATVKVLHYNDLTDAYRQVAAHAEAYQDTVIINRDNVSLNHILFSWGKPQVDATIPDSNPLTLQLFKLAMSVFSRPLNIQNLLSYLELPIGPVPRKLRSALAYVLTSEGGFGELPESLKKQDVSTQWDLAIYDYIHDDQDQQLTQAKRKSKTKLLRYITDSSLDDAQEIPTEVLKTYIKEFNQWASPIAFGEPKEDEEPMDEMLRSQLATVISYFKQLADTLKDDTSISYANLEKHVRTIYQPTTIAQARAQVGSLKVVSSYQQLLDSPARLLWLDCCGADTCADAYEFLSATERTWLSAQANVTIPRLQDILDGNRREMIATLARIEGEITLVTADYHHNQKMAEHPLVAELKMLRGDSLTIEEGCTDLELSDSKEILKVEPKAVYQLGEIDYRGRSESNTSIDTLINYPFDYTMRYVARLSEPTKRELGSLQKITGLVAHCFVEGLVDTVASLPSANRCDVMSQLLADEYDIRLQKAIYTTGLTLALKENEVDYNNLHFLLKRSIEVLIAIMKAKGLTPVGCEVKYDKPLGNAIQDFNARIDMELEDSHGRAVIFDFKWSYSTFYAKKIKEGNALQLELYRRELQQQGKAVAAVGYYLFPQCLLVTPDYDTLKDARGRVIIEHIEPPHDADLFIQIQNSVEQRNKEILAGDIEEGEEMDIKALAYSQALIDGADLLTVGKVVPPRDHKKKEPDSPVDVGKITKESNKVFTTKPEARFTMPHPDYEQGSDPLHVKPTTYPLMKGRLK